MKLNEKEEYDAYGEVKLSILELPEGISASIRPRRTSFRD